MNKYLYFLLLSLCLFSCKKEKNTDVLKTQTTQKEIIEKNTIDGYWILQKIDDKIFDIDKIIGFDQNQPTMIINLKEKTVQGFSGCNSYGGRILNNVLNLNFSNNLSFSPITATQMGCNINDWETNYFNRLSEIQKFEFIGKDLKVFGQNGETMLFVKRILKPLEKGRWELSHINEKVFDIKKEVNENESQPIIMFDYPKGKIGGYSGCNSFSTNAKFLENQFITTGTESDARACNGNWDKLFWEVLEQNKNFQIKNDSILILTSKKGSELQFKKLPL